MNKRFLNKLKFLILLILTAVSASVYLHKPMREHLVYMTINGLNFIKYSFIKSENASDIETLKSEKLFLQNQISLLSQENKKLTDELGFRLEAELTKVPLKILGQRSSLYNDIYLKSDKNLNLYKGVYVYGPDNLVIGLIDEVYENYSKVAFLGQNNRFYAEILSSGEVIELSASGVGLYYGKLPKSTVIENGEVITLRGYPKAIVGNVSQIEEDNTSLNTIWVRSPINILDRDIYYVDAQ